MSDTPSPLTPPDCDCADLDGFMLNTERLMASELVAVSSLEVIGAAVLLWARAWKQQPAASLPDDERVMAAFCKMPLPRFRKLRDEIMRGFVKCSDGRWYHRFLSVEAVRAYERKAAYMRRREADAKRLNEWRKKRQRNDQETADETRFVAEDTIRYDTIPITDTPSLSSEGVAREARPPPKPRAEKFPLPEDWQPCAQTVDALHSKGYSDHEITWQRDRFLAHFIDSGERRPGWDRSFFKWVTGDRPGKFDPARNGQGNRPGRTGIVAGVSRLLDAMDDGEPDQR